MCIDVNMAQFCSKNYQVMKKIFLLLATISLFNSCTSTKETDTKSVSIQLIRNATLKIKYNEKTFLVDPSLSPKQSFMSFVVPNQNLNPTVDLPFSVNEVLSATDAVLVTHTHLDHFDEGAKTELSADISIFGQPFDKAYFENTKFENVSTVENNTEYEGTIITRTKGKHGPDEMLEALGEVSGFVLKAKNYPTVYIVGDCLFDEEIKRNIKDHNPDIIVMNTGGAVFGGATILMNEKEAVKLAKFAPKAKVIAVHMESLDHCKTTRNMIREEAKKENVQILVPNDGETINL